MIFFLFFHVQSGTTVRLDTGDTAGGILGVQKHSLFKNVTEDSHAACLYVVWW